MLSIDDKIFVHSSIFKFLTEIDPDLNYEGLNLLQNTHQLKIIYINYEINGKSKNEID